MTELFSLYWPTILAACLTGATLSAVGALLVTRKAAVQTLAVSQSAGFGVSLGLLLVQLHFANGHLEHTLLPLLTGLAMAALGFSGTEWLAGRSHSPTVVYLAAFGIFWAISQLLTGLFPVVESHATALYFGDVVTLTRGESFFFMALSLSLAAFLLAFWRKISGRVFLSAILEEPVNLKRPLDLGFYLTSLTLVCVSVQLLGLLFTLSALFAPTAVYSYSRRVGAGAHLWKVAACGFLAAAAGFSYSLVDSRFLTTPLIALLMALIPASVLVFERFFRCK